MFASQSITTLEQRGHMGSVYAAAVLHKFYSKIVPANGTLQVMLA